MPSRTMTLASTITARYASFCCTRGSRSGRISSAAVARRIRPRRCSLPSSSTYPFGSSNSTSVRNPRWELVVMAAPRSSLFHALDAFVDQFEQLDQHLVALGIQVGGVVLDGPGLAHDEARGIRSRLVLHDDHHL